MIAARLKLALILGLHLAMLSENCGAPPTCAEIVCLDLARTRHTGVGFATDAVELVDVDNDGHLDLVTAGHTFGTLSVVWGSSDMFEGTVTTWSIAPTVLGLSAGHLDGDDYLDLATIQPDTDSIAVLHGRGGRDFASATLHTTPAHPRNLIAIDLDSDGVSELVTIHAGGVAHVLHNLVAGPALSLGGEPQEFAAGDLDGDGVLDLALALPEQGVLQLLLGDGAGGLTTGPRLPAGSAPNTVRAGDFDDDGTLDLAATDVLDDALHVLFGDGAGGVRDLVSWPTHPGSRALVVTSMGGGPPILSILSSAAGVVQRIDPRSGDTVRGASFEYPRGFVSGDIDGDSVDELFVADEDGNLGVVAPGPGLRVAHSWQPGAEGTAFPIALDDDRDALVIDLSPQPPGEVSARTRAIAIATGPDQLSAPLTSGLQDSLLGALSADFNSDGRRELVVWNRSAIAVHEQLADGAFTMPITLQSNTSRGVVAGDVDGDGRLELLAADPPHHLRVFAPLADQPNFADIELEELPDAIAARDIDGDNVLDLVLWRFTRVLAYPGMRVDLPPRIIGLDNILNVDALEFVDLEGDGTPDAFVCHSLGLARYPDLLTPAGGDIEKVSEARCLQLAATDLDNDGITELLSLNLWDTGIVITPYRLESGEIEQLGSYSFDGPKLPRLAHLTGSGPLDLVVPRPDRHIEILEMSIGTTLQVSTRYRLGATLGLSLGDFDGDGALDLLGLGDVIGVAYGDSAGFGPMVRTGLERAYPAARSILHAAVGDLDSDGDDEIVLSSRLHGFGGHEVAALDVAEMTVTPVTERSPGPQRALVADIDGDRQLDLLTLTEASGIHAETLLGRPVVVDVTFLRGRPESSLAAPNVSHTVGTGDPLQLRTLDFDSDGRLDLVTPSGGLGVHRGRGNGNFDPVEQWSQAVAIDLAAGDLDRDGHLDVAAILLGTFPARDDLAVIFGDAGTLGHPQVVLSGTSALAIADVDLDGEVELLATGKGALHVGTSQGGTGLRFISHNFPHPDPEAIRVLDLNDDGTPEIALINHSGITVVRQEP